MCRVGFCEAYDRDDILGLAVGDLLSNGFTDNGCKRLQDSGFRTIATGLP